MVAYHSFSSTLFGSFPPRSLGFMASLLTVPALRSLLVPLPLPRLRRVLKSVLALALALASDITAPLRFAPLHTLLSLSECSCGSGSKEKMEESEIREEKRKLGPRISFEEKKKKKKKSKMMLCYKTAERTAGRAE